MLTGCGASQSSCSLTFGLKTQNSRLAVKITLIASAIILTALAGLAVAHMLLPNLHSPLLFTANFSKAGALIFAIGTGSAGLLSLGLGLALDGKKRRGYSDVPSSFINSSSFVDPSPSQAPTGGLLPSPQKKSQVESTNLQQTQNLEDALGMGEYKTTSVSTSHIASQINLLHDHPFNKASLIGLFDCQGPNGVATFIEGQIEGLLKFELNKLQNLSQENIQYALTEVFATLDRRAKSIAGGSSVSACLIINNRLYVANAGDSRTIICKKNLVRTLSEESVVTKPEYEKMVTDNGGAVRDGKVSGMLRCATGIGHWSIVGLKENVKVISPVPTFATEDLSDCTDNDFLIIASEGFWRVTSPSVVLNSVNMKSPGTTSKGLAETLLDMNKNNMKNADVSKAKVLVIPIKSLLTDL